MKYLTIFFLTILFCASTYAQNSTKARTLVYDSLSKSYLCSVPEEWFDNDSVNSLHCDTANVNYTFLPIVRLHGLFSNDYQISTIDIFMPEDNDLIGLTANIKWRGATSNHEKTHKRNYHIKFIDNNGEKKDYRLFNLRKDNSWILNAANNEISRIRNRAAMNIWNEFATKPYYADREPKALTGTRGQFVELFLNNEYMGIYDFSENIDRSQLKLKKVSTDENGNSVIHGQLWKGFAYQYANLWNVGSYDNKSEIWGGIETKYPDLNDVSVLDYSTLYNFIKFVCTAGVNRFNTQIGDYADIPTIVDYFTFIYLIAAVDNYSGKNMMWACYDKQQDKKLTLIPWDLDCSVGRYYIPNGINPEYLEASTYNDHYWGNLLFYRLDSCRTGYFHQQVIARYNELRNTYFTLDNLTHHYTDLMDMLTKCGAYERERKRWSGDSDVFGQTLDFKYEKEFITNWLKVRLETIDHYGFPDSNTGLPTIESDIKNNNYAIYNINGQRVTSYKKKGLYIINGKKIIVK